MARSLLIVHRHSRAVPRLERHVQILRHRLIPAHISARMPLLSSADGVAAVVFNPNRCTRMRETSSWLGVPIGELGADWHTPGAAAPEGSYALLRSNAERAELVADAAASRTIWYVLTETLFVASTSQRAIVALLGDFEPNEQVVAWLLSSGTLGPEGGWDSRLCRVGPGERVVLDRCRWTLATTPGPVVQFGPGASVDRANQSERLESLVARACQGAALDSSRWILPLSGGVDSRGLLLWLRQRGDVDTITWGVGTALEQAGNDARIAAEISEKLNVHNRFFPINLSKEPRETLIRRFLTAGEGRVASISGYVDGFSTWRALYEEEFDVIIRGDHGFGAAHVSTEHEARRVAWASLLTDFFDAERLRSFELPSQRLPADLERAPRETLAAWRDRLCHRIRIPLLCAGLTELKTAYVEVANPLLASELLAFVRTLPDDLRTQKQLWRKLVASKSQGIPFARRPAILPLQDFLYDPAVLEIMRTELSSANDGRLLSPALRRYLCEVIKTTLRAPEGRRAAPPTQGRFSIVPARLRSATRRWLTPRPSLHPMVFAFRGFIVARMSRLLREDAESLRAEMRRTARL